MFGVDSVLAGWHNLCCECIGVVDGSGYEWESGYLTSLSAPFANNLVIAATSQLLKGCREVDDMQHTTTDTYLDPFQLYSLAVLFSRLDDAHMDGVLYSLVRTSYTSNLRVVSVMCHLLCVRYRDRRRIHASTFCVSGLDETGADLEDTSLPLPPSIGFIHTALWMKMRHSCLPKSYSQQPNVEKAVRSITDCFETPEVPS